MRWQKNLETKGNKYIINYLKLIFKIKKNKSRFKTKDIKTIYNFKHCMKITNNLEYSINFMLTIKITITFLTQIIIITKTVLIYILLNANHQKKEHLLMV
jgi:hypothetical protein